MRMVAAAEVQYALERRIGRMVEKILKDKSHVEN